MADVAQGKSYPEYILHLNKDTSEEKIKQTFDEWADTYEEVSLTCVLCKVICQIFLKGLP